ncbi:MAG: efflux RND transporter permease subunit, partial [Candidatus Binataceae bacterium]
MWIVRLALRRPLSVAVMALLMLVLGTLSFELMNVDIFPAINLPVVLVVWNYPGLSAFDVERRMVLISERAYSTTVNGIEHIESESINGLGILKVYFQPGTDLGSAIAQINAVSETILSILPRGGEPPQIISYNATNVPVAQLNVYSDTLSTARLFDYGLNFIRIQLFTIPGFSSPAPLGGVSRSVMVNIDSTKLYANGMSAYDLGNALDQANIVIPSGTEKIGNVEYNVDLNMSVPTVKDFDKLPIKYVNGAPVLLGDIAPVTDSHQPATNVVRVDGRQATYLMVIKHADASTLAVVDAVKAKLPLIRATAPKGLKVSLSFDQSQFVRAALWDVVQEAVIAATLVALMVLLFLGSPRSMLIVITSIPLSILTSIILLNLCGQTINTMTLGGIALAVGMLVDDATVEIENIHRNQALDKPLLVAILDGASQIATPTFVGTLSICIVFFPVVLLTGVARFLFTPLALAVVFAMLTSYLLSRTLVPSMARYLLPANHEEHLGKSRLANLVRGFDRGFERVKQSYRVALATFIGRRGLSLVCAAIVILLSLGLLPIVGEDFFPAVDAGMMRLHLRAPTGSRIEHTEWVIDQIDRTIRTIIPASELQSISDNIGLPISYDLAFYQTDSIGPQDADVLIQLKANHRPTAIYEQRIRGAIAAQYPNVTAYFQAADIVSQVLNFGLPAAIDAQINGNSLQSDYDIALRLKQRMLRIPGVVDLRIAEPLDYPTFKVDVDRTKALQFGITQQQVAASMLASLSGAQLLQPNFWLDPVNGVNYNVITQARQHLFDSIGALQNIPLSTAGSSTANATADSMPASAGATTSQPQLLGNLSTITHAWDPAVVAHYTVQRVIDVDCNVSGRDLGAVTSAVEKEIGHLGKMPAGTQVVIRGQSQAMRSSFVTLGEGLILAIALVYLLMVANFQSWLEPFIIMMAVPGALAGVLWMMVLTGTTINVESMMGAIMAVGVGVANGNLLITFANELREDGYGPVAAAIEA